MHCVIGFELKQLCIIPEYYNAQSPREKSEDHNSMHTRTELSHPEFSFGDFLSRNSKKCESPRTMSLTFTKIYCWGNFSISEEVCAPYVPDIHSWHSLLTRLLMIVMWFDSIVYISLLTRLLSEKSLQLMWFAEASQFFFARNQLYQICTIVPLPPYTIRERFLASQHALFWNFNAQRDVLLHFYHASSPEKVLHRTRTFALSGRVKVATWLRWFKLGCMVAARAMSRFTGSSIIPSSRSQALQTLVQLCLNRFYGIWEEIVPYCFVHVLCVNFNRISLKTKIPNTRRDWTRWSHAKLTLYLQSKPPILKLNNATSDRNSRTVVFYCFGCSRFPEGIRASFCYCYLSPSACWLWWPEYPLDFPSLWQTDIVSFVFSQMTWRNHFERYEAPRICSPLHTK